MFIAQLALLAALPTAIVLGAGPAQATSCVGWPDDVSDQILHGRLPDLTSAGGGATRAFTDFYDYAVIGTARGVTETGGNSLHAEARIDVRAALFRPVGPTVTLEMLDPGYMNGYPFEDGRTYLIPVKSVSPDGLHNYVMVCDPIREVATSEVAGILTTARSAGVPVTETTPATVSGVSRSAADVGEPVPEATMPAGRGWMLWAGIGVVVLLVAGAGGVALRRRLHSHRVPPRYGAGSRDTP